MPGEAELWINAEAKRATAEGWIGSYNLYVNYLSCSYGGFDGLLVLQEYDAPNGAVRLRTLLTRLVRESTEECDLLKKAIVYFPQNDEPSDERGYIQAILSENAIRRSVAAVLISEDFSQKSGGTFLSRKFGACRHRLSGGGFGGKRSFGLRLFRRYREYDFRMQVSSSTLPAPQYAQTVGVSLHGDRRGALLERQSLASLREQNLFPVRSLGGFRKL